jgi:hypothetical protein
MKMAEQKSFLERHSGLAKGVVAAGLFTLGYWANSIFASPEALQTRYEKKVAKHPTEHVQSLNGMFEFSYNELVQAGKDGGADVSQIEGIRPVVYLKDGNKGILAIEDARGQEPKRYDLRKINSDLATQLGTDLALGTTEQSLDQFVATMAEEGDMLATYPKEKRDVITKYTFQEAKSGAKELYDKVMSWIK